MEAYPHNFHLQFFRPLQQIFSILEGGFKFLSKLDAVLGFVWADAEVELCFRMTMRQFVKLTFTIEDRLLNTADSSIVNLVVTFTGRGEHDPFRSNSEAQNLADFPKRGTIKSDVHTRQ